MGVTDAVEILAFLIWQLLHWLSFGCSCLWKGDRSWYLAATVNAVGVRGAILR
jgi:hypothetical protein